MTTAKPGHGNAGTTGPASDRAEDGDDLIAQLARLMSDDPPKLSQPASEREVKTAERTREDSPAFRPSVPAAEVPAAAVRQPPSQVPIPPAVTQRPAAPAPVPMSPIAARPAEPARPRPAPGQDFAFDFGFTAPSAATRADRQVDRHEAHPGGDAIGDLIAAEMAAEPQLEDAPAIAPPAIAAAPRAEPRADVKPEDRTAPDAAPRAEPKGSEARVSEKRAFEAPDAQSAADRFRIAPVFGLSGAAPATPTAPRREPDATPVLAAVPGISLAPVAVAPIADVRAAIENAVSLDPVAAAKPVPSPAPRSLATPVMPRPEPVRQAEPHSGTPQADTPRIDQAIIAAAAQGGAPIAFADEKPARWARKAKAAKPEKGEKTRKPAARERAPVPERPFNRRALPRYTGAAVAMTMLLAAGAGLYVVLGNATPSGPAPVLTAEATPVKEMPETATASVATPQSAVMNEISGTAAPVESEQLVSRDQSEATEVAALTPEAEPAEEAGLVNRRVRTVTVRPDGTIVGGDQAVAGASTLPVDRPVVPALTSTTPAPSAALANAQAEGEAEGAGAGIDADADPIGAVIETAALDPAAIGTGTPSATTTPAGALPATPAVDAATLLVPGQPASVVDASGNAIAGRTAPVPLAPLTRPSAASGGAGVATATAPINAIVPTASPTVTTPVQTASASSASPAATTPATQAPAYVQLSSQRSEEAARETAQALSARFGTLFGGTPLEVQRIDLGDRGIYYRVRLPSPSLSAANETCQQVLAGGGECFTL